MKPYVSVVLPFYNAQDTLAEAVESILGQTLTDWELVLVNNASTDKGADIARTYAERDRRVFLCEEPRKGVSYAYNEGVARTTAPFVARMDADDSAHPQRLERQVAALRAEPALDAVSCRVEYRSEQPNTEGFRRYVDWVNSFLEPERINLNRFVESPVVNPTALFRREAWRKHGGCRHGDFPEDYDQWLRWLEAGARIRKLPEKLHLWRDRPERLTRTDPRYRHEAFYRLKAEYLAPWLQKHNPRHPHIYCWGGGALTRKRAAFLEAHGVRILAYLDIDPDKIGQNNVIDAKELPDASPDGPFVVSYVASRGARPIIRAELARKGYQEGRNCLFAA